MHTKFFQRLCALMLLSSAGSVPAAPGDPLDLEERTLHYHESYSVNADGTAVQTVDWSQVILKESAIEDAKSASIYYSTSAQRVEAVTGYTLKPDGRRIEVPKDNFQLVENRGSGGGAPVYSDHTTLTVIFPELAVGDTIALSYRLVQTDPLFPGKFSVADSFGSQQAYDAVRVRIDWPAGMAAQHASHGMEELPFDAGAGRKGIEWRYANPKPLQTLRENWSVRDFDRETGYAFSTFRDYADISASYGARAAPKAAVTERVRKLAGEIVGDASGTEAQTRKLYDWVATTISYAGNCIGIGAVVPRDLDFVLDNRMGDCKDHATLLQALLAARGIHSIQALINAGSVYRLPKVPVVSIVNHVINYIPALDLYLDSTSSTTPYGSLPGSARGKPVLLVENFRADARTPAARPDQNSERTHSEFAFAEDGSLSGTTEVFQQGDPATSTRAWARRSSRNDEDDLVRNAFRRMGLIASGSFEKDDPVGLKDSYRFKLSYQAQKYLRLPGAGAFAIVAPSGGGSVGKFLQFSDTPEEHADVFCRSGMGRDEYEITFPKSVQLLSIPDDVKLESPTARYEARYRLKGNVLSVTRELVDRTEGHVCTPEVAAKYKPLREAVQDDLKAQVLYKLPKRGQAPAKK